MSEPAPTDELPTISEDDFKVAITLASLTYLDENDADPFTQRLLIETYLAFDDLPTAGWELVWGPANYKTNLWYIAQDQATKRLALVIRGTVMSSWTSKLDDIDIPLVDTLVVGAPDGVKVAHGLVTAHHHLNCARDVWSNKTAWEYLEGTLAQGQTLDVVGHSLGGALAPIIALDAMQKNSDAAVRSIAIAGMSPGNQAFSDWYVSKLAHQQHSRFINKLDIIPEWYAGLRDMKHGFSGGPSLPLKFWLAVEAMVVLMSSENIAYVATPNARTFPGELYSKRSWTDEAEGQHEHLYYMFLAGVDVDVIQRRFGRHPQWVPPGVDP